MMSGQIERSSEMPFRVTLGFPKMTWKGPANAGLG